MTSSSYTKVFGNDTIPAAENNYGALSLTANIELGWPENATGDALLYELMDISSTGDYTITLPAASEVSVGRSTTLHNASAYTLIVQDYAGGTVGTLAAGAVRVLYVTDNSSLAGVWGNIAMGAGSTVADAAALAGYGLQVVSSKLTQSYPSATSASSYALLLTDRAKTLVFSGSGAVSLSLLQASVATDGFFINVSNQGTGTVTIDPYSTETIDGELTKALAPGESATVVCASTKWVTVGYGRSTQFQFTKLVLDISTGSPFTLTSTQAENKLLQFIGTATTNISVIVPAVVAVYYVQASYSGAYSLTIGTAAGAYVTLASNDRAIIYCDGADVVLAQTSAAPATDLAGGVAGSLVYQSAIDQTSFSAAGVAGQLVLSGGTGAPTFSGLGALVAAAANKATPVAADKLLLSDSEDSNIEKHITFSKLQVAGQIHAAAEKITFANNDEIGGTDSVSSFSLVRWKWSSLVSALSSIFQAAGSCATAAQGAKADTALQPAAIGTTVLGYVAPGTSGNVLTSNGSAWTSAAPPAVTIPHGAALYTASGSWTVPAGVTTAEVEVVSGGGGSSYYNGGDGALCRAVVSGLTPGASITITVGAGGAGVASSSSNGSSGGASSFGSYITCTGGGGGDKRGGSEGANGSYSTSATVTVIGGPVDYLVWRKWSDTTAAQTFSLTSGYPAGTGGSGGEGGAGAGGVSGKIIIKW